MLLGVSCPLSSIHYYITLSKPLVFRGPSPYALAISLLPSLHGNVGGRPRTIVIIGAITSTVRPEVYKKRREEQLFPISATTPLTHWSYFPRECHACVKWYAATFIVYTCIVRTAIFDGSMSSTRRVQTPATSKNSNENERYACMCCLVYV